MSPAGRKGSTASRITVNSITGDLPGTAPKYTKREIKEWRQLFAMFDTDGSGAIGNEELKEVDIDGNGEIDFEEFCACMKKSQTIVRSTNEELIKECFQVFDLDQNGVISEDEFKVRDYISSSNYQYIAKEVGDFDDELAEKVFRELDISSNGHLTADQFANVVEDYLLSDHNHRHSEN